MSFEDLFRKHEAFIKERWLPISIDLMLLEGPEKKISFLKEAQRQASKEIQNIEEKSAFIKFLEIEIHNIQNKQSKKGVTKGQMSAQSNEPRTTESVQIEKINWEAGLAELAFIIEILFKNEDIGFSMKQYKKRWSLIAKHFTVKGEEITSEGLRHAFSQLKTNKNEGKPANHAVYETLFELSQEIED
jgi:hypothetical protein